MVSNLDRGEFLVIFIRRILHGRNKQRKTVCLLSKCLPQFGLVVSKTLYKASVELCVCIMWVDWIIAEFSSNTEHWGLRGGVTNCLIFSPLTLNSTNFTSSQTFMSKFVLICLLAQCSEYFVTCCDYLFHRMMFIGQDVDLNNAMMEMTIFQ